MHNIKKTYDHKFPFIIDKVLRLYRRVFVQIADHRLNMMKLTAHKIVRTLKLKNNHLFSSN